MTENNTEPNCRTDAESADEYSDDELEESWLHYVNKYVNSEMEGLDLLKLDMYEIEMNNRGWSIRVTEDEQEVDRNGKKD